MAVNCSCPAIDTITLDTGQDAIASPIPLFAAAVIAVASWAAAAIVIDSYSKGGHKPNMTSPERPMVITLQPPANYVARRSDGRSTGRQMLSLVRR